MATQISYPDNTQPCSTLREVCSPYAISETLWGWQPNRGCQTSIRLINNDGISSQHHRLLQDNLVSSRLLAQCHWHCHWLYDFDLASHLSRVPTVLLYRIGIDISICSTTAIWSMQKWHGNWGSTVEQLSSISDEELVMSMLFPNSAPLLPAQCENNMETSKLCGRARLLHEVNKFMLISDHRYNSWIDIWMLISHFTQVAQIFKCTSYLQGQSLIF